ncbi:MAG: STAS domain-containing protein [Planctomycetes bacterium]|nr:STAS domain-containing protein [Planctomycetota bacterium]
MFLQKEVSKDEIILQITGPLNGEPANEFQKHLEELSVGSHKTITLNLSEVSSINSSCIGKILLFRKKLAEQDRTIRIRGCSDSLYNTFQLIKFDKLLSIEK